jgi:hypothetical protein
MLTRLQRPQALHHSSDRRIWPGCRAQTSRRFSSTPRATPILLPEKTLSCRRALLTAQFSASILGRISRMVRSRSSFWAIMTIIPSITSRRRRPRRHASHAAQHTRQRLGVRGQGQQQGADTLHRARPRCDVYRTRRGQRTDWRVRVERRHGPETHARNSRTPCAGARLFYPAARRQYRLRDFP